MRRLPEPGRPGGPPRSPAGRRVGAAMLRLRVSCALLSCCGHVERAAVGDGDPVAGAIGGLEDDAL